MGELQGIVWLVSISLLVIGTALLVLDDDRWLLLALMLHYLTTSTLLALEINFQVGAAKLVTGLLTGAIIAFSLARTGWHPESVSEGGTLSGRTFRLIAALIVGLTALGIGTRNWLMIPGVSATVFYGSSIAMSYGLLQLGLFRSPIRVGIGLLCLISGFEILYSSIEPSLAVSALLAGVHFGIGLLTGYLVTIESSTTTQDRVVR
jgi:hypothetical protein